MLYYAVLRYALLCCDATLCSVDTNEMEYIVTPPFLFRLHHPPSLPHAILPAHIKNEQESMADTSEFIDSLKTSLWVIWAGYSIFGGASLLVFQQHGPVGDNIMTQLPGHTAALEPLL